MQNLVVLMEPSEIADDVALKAGNMILNRFCIDEDAAFELSGVNYLKKSSLEMEIALPRRRWGRKRRTNRRDSSTIKAERKVKGKEYSV